MACPQDAPQQRLQEELQPQAPEVCCWRFEPVKALGREGVIVLSAKRLLFASHKGSPSKSADGEGDASASIPSSSSSSSSCWELLLQFPLAAWTATERSKKAAKARMSYFVPTAAAAAAAEAAGGGTGMAVQSVVVDFLGVREKMELCCRSLQTLASASRTVQSSSSLLCPLEVPLLLQLLQLPAETPLRIAPALLQQEDLRQQQLQQQQQQQLQQQQAQLQQLEGPQSDRQESEAAGSAAKAEGASAAAPAATDRQHAAFLEPSAATAAAPLSPPEPPSLEKLLQQQRQQESEQLQQFQQQLLQQNRELMAVYQALVGPPDAHQSVDATSHGGLSDSEFWRLHQQQLQALQPQPAPEAVSASFLSRPPQYHMGPPQSGQAGLPAELVVDCSEQMLSQILKEDSTIRTAHAALVETGRMAADRFWGRIFRSQYFQRGIGLPERQKESDDAEASAFVAAFLKETPLSARDTLSLPGIERTLLSDADLRVRGFGLPDGLSSLAGDLAELPVPPSLGSAAAPSGDATATASVGCLVSRFNRHSQRLLLQQLLQPAAAAAAISDTTGPQEKLQLLLQQEQRKKHPRTSAGANMSIPAVPASEAATLGYGVLEEEAPLLASLRLEELNDAAPARYQTLEVSRRQLYAAGSRVSKGMSPAASAEAVRGGPSSATAAAAAAEATAGAPRGKGAANAADTDTATAENAQAAQEAKAAHAWLWAQKERANERNKGALQAAEEVAAVYETGRYMFVFNTKLCQKDKAAQVATLDYELATVNAVRTRQARLGELLRHFYSTTLPEDKKRTRLVQALDAIKAELENSQDFSGGFTGAATKALSAPLVEQITAARRHANRLHRLLQAAREKRATQQIRQSGQLKQQASVG
ncbi:uncharacterized protein LOC34623057 [Cyclospora cayetanensis]|uniref:Uncharacterized protein LOC34623057 n=1 Tax=Cyclospora cayetanensis TaxID=88456 RepID=A0A6P6RT34_9EIME|nr:uncharacterized protein LOC34623057 [Cyclospora cayetanensis]